MVARLVVVVLYKPGEQGKRYRIATESDLQLFKEAEELLREKVENWRWLDNPLPDDDINNLKGRINIYIYGLRKWQDLFNSRQKLALITFMEKIKLAYERIQEDCRRIGLDRYGLDAEEAAKVVMGYLALGMDRLVDFGSKLCTWNYTGGRGVGHTLTRQALPMVWDYPESNPFNPKAAGWPTACEKTKNGSNMLQQLLIGQQPLLSIPLPHSLIPTTTLMQFLQIRLITITFPMPISLIFSMSGLSEALATSFLICSQLP